ncbi:hypothetical protein ACODM8_05095 [Vibrio ostreicida]|uniref:Uncharacterized protein n=1 Tax=Vibrio ostreicida TaxID=526588 RepID=A0ABT8BWM2_9VIBR|nr:hypothetical protein [Vibrio ostreicida]MDN3611582.1 hypothetical protein [Vibrio ostreicida]NPD09074.1 hypothetical protein [Vibrio ostreicida]
MQPNVSQTQFELLISQIQKLTLPQLRNLKTKIDETLDVTPAVSISEEEKRLIASLFS